MHVQNRTENRFIFRNKKKDQYFTGIFTGSVDKCFKSPYRYNSGRYARLLYIILFL